MISFHFIKLLYQLFQIKTYQVQNEQNLYKNTNLFITQIQSKLQPQISNIKIALKDLLIYSTQRMFSRLQFVNAVKNPLSKIKASIREMITKQKVQIIEIIPQKVFHISAPTNDNLGELLEEFKTANQFQLWNISEYSYPEQVLTSLLDGRQRNSDGRQIVYNLTYEYFASIPFCQMIKAIQSIEAFLTIHPSNKVYIHCQQNKRRSAIFLACYIFLTGQQTDIVSSILKVNRMLNISMEDKELSENSPGSIYKSQHLVLKNLMNYINNSSFINKNAWNLKKILINNAPQIHSILKLTNQKSQTIKFKVLLQIRTVEGIAYKKIFHDQFIEGESLCLRIPAEEEVVLKDDFLIIIKYVHEKKGYSILRAQLNTNFIYDQYFRVQRNDMDLSVNNAHTKNQTVFMDLLLQVNQKQQSELSQLNVLKESAEKQTKNSSQEEIKLNQKSNVQASVEKKEEKKNEQDEEDGFGILDEQQEAVHNQKMQREIEEELARELQNIRKKRNQQTKTSQQKITLPNENQSQNKLSIQSQNQTVAKEEVSQQKQSSEKKVNQTSNLTTLTEKIETQKPTQEKMDETVNQIENAQQKEQSEDENQNKEVKNHSSSDQESSQDDDSSEDSSEEEVEEDLEDYLSKLQKQAEKHD